MRWVALSFSSVAPLKEIHVRLPPNPMQLINDQSVVHLFTILVPGQLTRWIISVVFRMVIHLEKRVKQVGLDL